MTDYSLLWVEVVVPWVLVQDLCQTCLQSLVQSLVSLKNQQFLPIKLKGLIAFFCDLSESLRSNLLCVDRFTVGICIHINWSTHRDGPSLIWHKCTLHSWTFVPWQNKFDTSSRRANLFLLVTNKSLTGRGREQTNNRSDLPPLTLYLWGGRHRCCRFLWWITLRVNLAVMEWGGAETDGTSTVSPRHSITLQVPLSQWVLVLLPLLLIFYISQTVCSWQSLKYWESANLLMILWNSVKISLA